MQPSDWIQIAILAVLSATLVAVLGQYLQQNRLLRAQQLRDRFEMYWKLYEPMPADALQWMEVCPDDYMPIELYEERYKGNPVAQRKYAGMAQIYEFLAFSFQLEKLRLKDPLTYQWTRRWTADLTAHEEFRQVNQHYREYYPDFADLVDGLSAQRTEVEAVEGLGRSLGQPD